MPVADPDALLLVESDARGTIHLIVGACQVSTFIQVAAFQRGGEGENGRRKNRRGREVGVDGRRANHLADAALSIQVPGISTPGNAAHVPSVAHAFSSRTEHNCEALSLVCIPLLSSPRHRLDNRCQSAQPDPTPLLQPTTRSIGLFLSQFPAPQPKTPQSASPTPHDVLCPRISSQVGFPPLGGKKGSRPPPCRYAFHRYPQVHDC